MLTDREVRSLRPNGRPYKRADWGGLYLEVLTSGRRVWRHRFRRGGRQTTVTLGDYPTLSLAEARRRHAESRQSQIDGRPVPTAAPAQVASSFAEVAAEWRREVLASRSPKYLRQIERGLAKHVLPALGTRPMAALEPPEILGVIRKVATSAGAAQAHLIKQWIGGAFRYGVATGVCARDLTADLRGAMPRRITKHFRTITSSEIPKLVADLRAYAGPHQIELQFLWLLLLLFPRPSELREARWVEVDWDAALWRIPAARVKCRREHLVPLAAPVIKMLRELEKFAEGSEWIFPSRPGAPFPICRSAPHAMLGRLGWRNRIVPHGFRALASTTLNENGWRPEVIEAQLAHIEPNATRAAYNRALYLDERRKLMDFWCDLVLKPPEE